VEQPGGRLETELRRWRAPLGVAGGVAVAVLVALPFASRSGPTIPGLTSAWCAIVLLFDLLSVTLLVGLYRNGRGLRMLVLATAFAWSAIVVLVLALTTPGVVVAEPWLGGGEGWLYVSRHVGPPILIALALAPWPARWDDHLESRDRQGRLAALAGLAVLVLGPGLIALAVTAFPDVLPRIVDPGTGHFRPLVYALMLAVNVGGVAVGLYGVARREERAGLEAWAIVAAFAWLGDVAFVGLVDDRFSIAYYASRLLAVLAALIVPASILVDTWRLHQRLTAGAANLEAQVNRLLEAQRIRDHVSAVVSHDMRAPLAGLHGYLELLVDDEGLDAELVQRMHGRSLMLTRRLTLMCEDLLAATTIEHSDLVITPADLDLSQQLAECASGFPDLDLRIQCPRDVQVHADPLRLQQILSNLVRNAQIHGAEPITVDVSSDSQNVTIRVSDAGEGVPESFIPRLFERYSQGARALTGAGIGLSVVHDLVQAHRGTIRYDLTQPAFIVTLPVGASAEPPPEGRVLTAPRRGHVTT
jgi:signal transduction histidine kinase